MTKFNWKIAVFGACCLIAWCFFAYQVGYSDGLAASAAAVKKAGPAAPMPQAKPDDPVVADRVFQAQLRYAAAVGAARQRAREQGRPYPPRGFDGRPLVPDPFPGAPRAAVLDGGLFHR